MDNLSDLLWIELRKAIRSRIPLWTALGSLFMPLGVAFLIFVAKNPEISQKLGLVSAKANLMAYSATDWTSYLSLFGQLVAGGEYFILVLAVSWVFGREFADGTLKDMLAVPVARASILLAKFIVVVVWAGGLTVVVTVTGMIMGAVLGLPGGSSAVLWQGSGILLGTAVMVIGVVLPFALIASVGRGYLLPLGVAALMMLLTNFAIIAGWGEYFPWSIPMFYAQAKSALTPVSYWIVALTGVAGMVATYYWWKVADQSR